MTDLPRIGAPAIRALRAEGIETLEAAARKRPEALLALHGVGPRAISILAKAMEAAGMPRWTADD